MKLYKRLLVLIPLLLLVTPCEAYAFGGWVGGIVNKVLSVGGGGLGAAIGVGLAAFTGGLSLVAMASYAAVGYAVGTMAEVLINPPSFDMPDQSAAGAAAANTGILVNKQSTNIPIPVIYGTRRVGGARVFISTNGAENKFLYLALVLSEGEIDSISKVWIDDTLVWTGTTVSGTQYAGNTSNFKAYFTFQAFHGTTNQVASTLLKEASGWGDDKPLTALAYVACKCEWPVVTSNDQAKANPWQGLPNIVFEIRGKKVAYPTNLATAYTGLTYAQRQAFSSGNYLQATAWSNHPVDCLLDYLRNPTYGKGLTDTQIDWHSFYRERVRWSQGSNGLPLADNLQHKTDAVIFTERTVMDNIKTFLLNMRSSLVYQDGKYRLAVVDNGNDSSPYYSTSSSVMTIDIDDIISGIKIDAESADSKYNRVTVTYMGYIDGDKNKTYEPLDYTYPEPGSALDAQYLAEDGNRRVDTKMTFEHVTEAATAAKLAQIILDRVRNKGKTITFQGTSRLYQLEVGDVITLTYTSLDISGRYRVKSSIQNSDFTFQITLEEHDDVTYALNPFPKTTKKYNTYIIGSTNQGPGYPVNNNIVLPGPITNIPPASTTDPYSPPVTMANGLVVPYVIVQRKSYWDTNIGVAKVWFSMPYQDSLKNFFKWELAYQYPTQTEINQWSGMGQGWLAPAQKVQSTWYDAFAQDVKNFAGFRGNEKIKFRVTYYDNIIITPTYRYYFNYLTPSPQNVNGVSF